MIAKGNLHGDGTKLATYLTTGKEGERAELIELRGFPTDNIRDAFLAAQLGAEAKTQSTRPFFHTYVRLVEGESLNREQWQYVADRIEKRLGFEGQPRALAFHHLPDGATHLHIAWSRHDLEHDVALDPGLYKLKLKEISRQLEKELGLTQVRNERDPEQKTLAPGRNEFEQSRRLGTDLKAIREEIRASWERSDSGKAFEAALAEKGYILARGDRRDFVVIDQAGGDHALGKRITGVTSAETRARMTDVDRAHLPSVPFCRLSNWSRTGGHRSTSRPEITHQRSQERDRLLRRSRNRLLNRKRATIGRKRLFPLRPYRSPTSGRNGSQRPEGRHRRNPSSQPRRATRAYDPPRMPAAASPAGWYRASCAGSPTRSPTFSRACLPSDRHRRPSRKSDRPRSSPSSASTRPRTRRTASRPRKICGCGLSSRSRTTSHANSASATTSITEGDSASDNPAGRRASSPADGNGGPAERHKAGLEIGRRGGNPVQA